jgi:hypothetical protein
MIPRICFEATGCSDESPDGERWREHEIPCHAFQKKKRKEIQLFLSGLGLLCFLE